MDDSEVEIEGPVENKPTGPLEIVVKNNNGTLGTRLKDPKTGKFLKKPKPMPDAKEVTRLMRTLLNSAEGELDSATGKVRVVKGTKTRFRKMFDNMIRIASNEDNDPKAMMAAVKAFEVVALRALGKPSASDEELEALKVSGVKVVIIQPPELQHREVLEERSHDKLTPSFIEAEVVHTNER
jgi:hypothetical protein